MATKEQRREHLKEVFHEARGCDRCPQLASTRQTVVFGSGNADADVMFVGEAPGAEEDKQGLPFVGASGRLLEELLGEIGLRRADVFICNTLKCLRYNATVQLADGSWERIGRLVRSGYAGRVMSLSPDGRLEPRRVIGWHQTPLGEREVWRLSYASAKRAGRNSIGIYLTGDHPVLTERGCVAVAELRDDDRVAVGHGLSDVAFDVVCGTLLGDGTIQHKSSALTIGHSARQADYARAKADALAELAPSLTARRVAAVAGGTPVYDVVHLATPAHRALRLLRADFYRPTKVVPNWIADRLNPRMLAIWFMDDGHLRVRPPRQPSAEIATNAFSDADLRVLLIGLSRLGLPAKALRGRIHFGVDATYRLAELIAPYVPAAMRHKVHPEVRERIAHRHDLLVPGSPRTMYDRVVTERVGPGADTTYFCIDVEEHHNFVTAGGVVHNCRPPSNRDPAPSELENCQGYLWRQLDLIEPTVVCTLGNFATKLLRGDTTGITRLHGKPEVRTLGPRTVRLLPLFHPAAALYQRSNVELLREDFGRIPELLAMGPPEQPAPLVAEEVEPELVPTAPEEPDAAAAESPSAEDADELRAREQPPPDDQLGLF